MALKFERPEEYLAPIIVKHYEGKEDLDWDELFSLAYAKEVVRSLPAAESDEEGE